jgi:hypothetical protein
MAKEAMWAQEFYEPHLAGEAHSLAYPQPCLDHPSRLAFGFAAYRKGPHQSNFSLLGNEAELHSDSIGKQAGFVHLHIGKLD